MYNEIMLISAKSTYAIRVLVDMAQNGGEEKYICISEIVERQKISRKYLESIMTLLSKNGIIDVSRGKCGGYRLNRKPEEYRLIDILSVTEEDLCPVPCLKDCDGSCPQMATCPPFETWKELQDTINAFFGTKTIYDLASSCPEAKNDR